MRAFEIDDRAQVPIQKEQTRKIRFLYFFCVTFFYYCFGQNPFCIGTHPLPMTTSLIQLLPVYSFAIYYDIIGRKSMQVKYVNISSRKSNVAQTVRDLASRCTIFFVFFSE